MAKKKLDTAMDKVKLDLSQTLYALDTRQKDYYHNLTDEMKKKYVPLILMRFMSSAPNQEGLHEYFLTTVNDIVNESFWTLSKHPELQHLLLATCGLGKKQYHSWIKMAPGKKMGKLREFIEQMHPGINDTELNLFVKMHTEEEFEELIKGYGLEDKEIEQYVKQFSNVKAGKEE